jgi:hypothetical protein
MSLTTFADLQAAIEASPTASAPGLRAGHGRLARRGGRRTGPGGCARAITPPASTQFADVLAWAATLANQVGVDLTEAIHAEAPTLSSALPHLPLHLPLTAPPSRRDFPRPWARKPEPARTLVAPQAVM